MFWIPRRRPGVTKPCRDEKISKSGGTICLKPVQSVAELLENRCRNCGRPFEAEKLETSEQPLA